MSEMIVRTKEDFKRAVVVCPDEVVFQGEMARVVKRVLPAVGGTAAGGVIGGLIWGTPGAIGGAIVGLAVGINIDSIAEFLKGYQRIEVSANGLAVTLSK